ncbi:hypothetical protein ACQKNX_11320 [Lysinibacillus sp. NPDC093712]|uniref:hypothetical protein n=1 Tax=Lysinibacillus sp. NPDC093712 TaxID=3390579 RepID=UPI003D03EA6C
MVQYYYDRFTTIGTPVMTWQISWGKPTANFGGGEATGNTDYNIDSSGKITLTGSVQTIGESVKKNGTVYAFSGSGTWLCRYIASGEWSVMDEYLGVAKQVETGTNYSKGALIQSRIPAEEGTYPANGRHTDGYWYVKGVKVNTAPTTPGAFTQPLGTLETGDQKVFTIGSSSDAEGNLSKYIWEVSINSAAYSKVGETATPSFTYTVPTASSLKMRVKAVDTEGLESTYCESSPYTVTQPKYYWNKYNAQSIYTKTYSVESWLQPNYYDYNIHLSVVDFYTSFSFDNNGIPIGSGSKITVKIGDADTTSETYPPKYLRSGSTYYLILKYTNEQKFISKFIPSSVQYYGVSGTEQWSDKITEKQEFSHFQQSSLVQNNLVGELNSYQNNTRNGDGYWYVRGSRVSQSIAPPALITAPIQGKIFKPYEVASIIFGASTAPNLSLYEVDYRYNSIGTWTPLAYNNTLTRSFTTTTDKALKTLELRVRAKNTSNVYSDYVYSEPFEIEHNVAPTITLTGPGDKATLYENDILNIAGTAFDTDADQSVTVYYQINNEPRKVLATNLSQTQISLSKQITFKGGKIYDGETALTGVLADGVAHMLKVWAEDSEKASSAIVERTFYVVPNRAPLLSVDAVVPSGVVDADKFKISGTASDQDANSTLKVTSRINAGNAVEIYSGSGGAWEFDLALSQLVVGQNTIVIEVIDNYGAKTSKTVTLNKKELKTPILQSVARYKIEPPKGSAKGVLLFIQRDEALDIKVELSMTVSDEQEQYETLTPVNTAPVHQGLVEDTFEYEGLEAKQNIILKITSSRTDLSFNHKIHLISGAVD